MERNEISYSAASESLQLIQFAEFRSVSVL